jgi:DNA polymerase-3 subunit beta
MGTNHLGHFLLVNLLLPDLLLPEAGARVVVVGSSLHDPKSSGGGTSKKPTTLGDLDDLMLERPGAYEVGYAYRRSKLANMLFACELHRRLKAARCNSVNVRALEKAFLRTVFCADTESTRYALGGIHLTEDGDKLAVIGTDGRRLATQAIDCTSIAHHRFDDGCCLIPERAARMLLRACNRSKGEALIAASINDAIFDFGDCQLVTRMVEGRYPNWRQVIPNVSEASSANFFVGPLLAAVRQAAIATGPESKGIEFTFASGTFRLHAQDSAIGESTVEIPCECDVEKPMTSKLDHTFVREFLSVLNPDSNCKMEFRGKNDPILASTDDGYRYVIMPMANERV